MKQILFFVISILSASTINAQLYLNEIVASNDSLIADNFGEYGDFIEIYNAGATPINLAGYYLSDEETTPLMWKIPATDATLTTIPAGGHLVFWADNDIDQGANHLNFKLSTSGETILLSNPEEVLVDSFFFPSVIANEGYGRLPDGSNNFSSLLPPTPLASNNNSQVQVVSPIISPSSGLYMGPQIVTISAETNASIYYTLDGSIPTAAATLYTGPFSLDSTQVVNAISIKNGFIDSSPEVAVYIIDSNHELAIVSVHIDSTYLWNDSLGMYVKGTNGIRGDCGGAANYFQEWEYPTNVMMFDEVGSEVFDVDGGLSIFGNCSRSRAQKNIQLKTKSQYPSPNIAAQIFPHKEQKEFRRLRFRAGGDWNRTMMADVVAQRLVEGKLDLETQSARPSVVYLNGAYWGVHNIREAYSQHYFGYKYPDYEGDDFDVIRFRKLHTLPDASMGDTIEIRKLYDYFEAHPNFNQTNYEYAQSQIDLNNFLNYYLLQMWLIPTDWPGTGSPSNEVIWRSSTSNSKWRMAVLDTDLGWLWTSHNTIDYMMVPNISGRNSTNATLLYRRLMGVPEFRNEFIQRYATQLNLLYNPSRVKSIIDDYKNKLDSEMTAHTGLWGSQGGVVDYDTWVAEVDSLKAFADVRSDTVRKHIAEFFSLSTFDLNLNVNANTKGTVAVNANYFKVPYNYTGKYFTDTPIEIHAIPAPGYRFSHWLETGVTNASLYESFTSNTTLTPVFEPTQDIVINEIHYHPKAAANNQEFIELFNPDDQARDLSSYTFTSGISFTFPEGTTIDAEEYILLAKDATTYEGNGYQVFEWEKSKLNNDGEKIVLQNRIQQTVDSVDYNDGDAWPLLADGFGFSLELNYPLPSDNTLAIDWYSSTQEGGTPGAQNTICEYPLLPVVINEINYNSTPSFDPSNWVEIYNPNSTAINLSNWLFCKQDTCISLPTGTSIVGNEYLVLVENSGSFSSLFPNLQPNTDYIDGFVNLSNKGERLSLFNNNHCLVDEVIFKDESPWPVEADGKGPTLALINTDLDNAHSANWEDAVTLSSYFPYGTPARSNLCGNVSTTTVSIQVDSSSDDAEEKIADGSVNLTSKDLDLVNDEGIIYIAGIRFSNISIPQGAKILSATIQFGTDEVNIDSTKLIIKGEAIDDAPTFEATPNNITNRKRTTNYVEWQPATWDRIGVQGIQQRTVNVGSVIQEIVDRPNFTLGNAIALLIEGTGIRTAKSFDGDSSLAPTLHITYTEEQCGIQAIVLLEGFYEEIPQQMHAKLGEKNLLPLTQPFNKVPWLYDGTENVSSIPSGVTDWILLSTRDSDNSILSQAVGFINQHGELLNLNGKKGIPLPDAIGKKFSIHHLSHLAVVSTAPYMDEVYDFTISNTQAQGTDQLKLKGGKYMLYSGDYDASGIINNTDFNNWKIQSAVLNQYIPIDGDGNGIINAADYNLWINNRSKVGEQVIRY